MWAGIERAQNSDESDESNESGSQWGKTCWREDSGVSELERQAVVREWRLEPEILEAMPARMVMSMAYNRGSRWLR